MSPEIPAITLRALRDDLAGCAATVAAAESELRGAQISNSLNLEDLFHRLARCVEVLEDIVLEDETPGSGILPITRFLGEDRIFTGEECWRLLCPICGFDYIHPGPPHVRQGHDDYRAGWWGRGDLAVLPFVGECGHEWSLCFGFHKGNIFVFVEPGA